jgi:uncharacterized protein YneF (UPF0154 family)
MSQEIERVNLDHKYYLKPYKRVNEDYIDLLMSLVSNGYSESKIDSTLKSLGLNYSKQHMDAIKKQLIERLE